MIPRWRLLTLCVGLSLPLCVRSAEQPKKDDKPGTTAAGTAKPDVKKDLLSGKVVLLTEALERKKIKAYPEELKGQVVLETAAGELWPIVPDWRGRAFYQDKRLRDRAVDLVVTRHAGVPYVQVLSIYTFDEKGVRQMTDYWCDICSIPMYEIKDCECCQGPIHLRFQPAELPADVAPPVRKPK